MVKCNYSQARQTQKSGFEKNSKIFQKMLDKPKSTWYNKKCKQENTVNRAKQSRTKRKEVLIMTNYEKTSEPEYIITQWCENASALKYDKAKLYLYAKQTGVVDEIPPFKEIQHFRIGPVVAEIEALKDFFIAVTIYTEKVTFYYIFEQGELVTVYKK